MTEPDDKSETENWPTEARVLASPAHPHWSFNIFCSFMVLAPGRVVPARGRSANGSDTGTSGSPGWQGVGARNLDAGSNRKKWGRGGASWAS